MDTVKVNNLQNAQLGYCVALISLSKFNKQQKQSLL